MTKKSKQKNKKRTRILIAASATTLLAYYLYLRLPRPTPIGINEVNVSPTSTVSLSLPSDLSASPNEEVTLPLILNTGGSKVSAVQIEITYDPSSISEPTVTQGNILSVELMKPKVSQGKLSFVYAAKPDSGGYLGESEIAKIKFKLLKDTAQISFGSDTMVAAVGIDSNVLKSASGTRISAASNKIPKANTESLKTTAPSPKVQPSPTSKTKFAPKPTPTKEPSSSARVFDQSGNFDYTRPAGPTSTAEATEDDTQISIFSAFLAFIKSFFKDANGNN